MFSQAIPAKDSIFSCKLTDCNFTKTWSLSLVLSKDLAYSLGTSIFKGTPWVIGSIYVDRQAS